MISFVEEIVLLLLDDDKGEFIDMPVSQIEIVVAGAALMDLALHNRVDTDLKQLIVADATPTGDDILDDALTRLVVAQQPLTIGGAIELIATYAGQYRQPALDRLVGRGILREDNGRFLWLFQRRRYPVIDDREEREVRQRLRQILLTDDIPEPRDVVMICLLDACRLLRLLLGDEEFEFAAPRIEQIRRMDLIGQAVLRGMSEIGLSSSTIPPRFTEPSRAGTGQRVAANDTTLEA